MPYDWLIFGFIFKDVKNISYNRQITSIALMCSPNHNRTVQNNPFLQILLIITLAVQLFKIWFYFIGLQ